jgi:hypothetical protein
MAAVNETLGGTHLNPQSAALAFHQAVVSSAFSSSHFSCVARV